MYKPILPLFFTALFLSCSQGAKQTTASPHYSAAVASQCATAEADVQEAEKQLRAAYTEVFAWYNRAEKDASLLQNEPDFDARYLSVSYLALKRQVEKTDSATVADGMIGFFDSNHWVCGQDMADLSFTIEEVKATDGGTCCAVVCVNNCNVQTRLHLPLVCEKGVWKIDDFVTDGASEKQRMTQYVKEQGRK